MTRSVPLAPLVAIAGLLAGSGTSMAQQAPPVAHPFTRIYQDSSGASRFADGALPLELVDPGRDIPPTPASALIPVSGLRIFCPPAGGRAEWHPVPARLYNLVLSGEIEVETSDGRTRRFGPGSLILAEDTAGRGHRTRVVGEGAACFAMILLPDEGA